MNKPQMYWHRYLKQRGLNKSKGGMFSITETAVMVHKTLYDESKCFNKPEAKKYLAEQKRLMMSRKEKFQNVKTNGCAYFIGNLEFLWVKIGSATNVVDRLSALQTGCPFELSIFAHIPSRNPLKTEKKLHRKFSKQRSMGEWFNLNDYMLGFINKIREQNEPYKEPISLEVQPPKTVPDVND